MTEAATPICDLIERLLSVGTSPGDAIAVARDVEVAMATSSGSTPEQRERWRRKKARQRARDGGQSTGDNRTPLSSTNTDIKQVKKNTSKVSPGDKVLRLDDWPTDHADQFWKAFPPYRRQAKAKVATKLARIRADGKVTWATLLGGVTKFAATNPGEYAPAPMVWLNDGRWDREYGTGGKNGTAQSANGGARTFAGIAAKIRYGGRDDESPPRPTPEDLQPINRR